MAIAEGKIFNFEDESKIDPNYLETFDFDSPSQYIKTETNEFSAVCPFSGLPDLAKIKIEYFPTGGKCVELKSLKYYFNSFRNVGIYQEAATKRIYDDLKSKGVEVIAAFKRENQCGCCGVELTSNEMYEITNSSFQQCPYCMGVVI